MYITKSFLTSARLGWLCLTLAAGSLASGAQPPGPSLYAKLGGKAGLNVIVNEFTQLVTDDPRINFTFADIDLDKFKALLSEQLCELSGGPCKYTGRDMHAAHVKLAIDNAQFNALAEDLYEAMERVRIPYRVQNQLMALLAPMQRDIVNQ